MSLSREQFSKAGVAERFASSKVHSDNEFLDKITSLAKQGPETRALDIATGTGFVAVAFSRKTKGLVIGTDITQEMLGWAGKHAEKEGVGNVSFLIADAARQPFPDRSFDNVVSRLAIHHIPEPSSVVNEMARLCKNGGRVIIADQISPEDLELAEFHDHFEKFRDPSHQRALKLSEFQKAYRDAGLRVEGLKYSPVLLQLQEWASRAGCNADRIDELRLMMLEAPSSYRNSFEIREEEGHVWFTLQRVIIAGTR